MTELTGTTKPLYESKTLWVNVIMALFAIFLPGTGGFITLHPELFTAFFAGVNIVLRLITKTALTVE